MRPGRPRHAPVRGRDAALRPRAVRDDQPVRGRRRLGRQARQGGFRRPRGPAGRSRQIPAGRASAWPSRASGSPGRERRAVGDGQDGRRGHLGDVLADPAGEPGDGPGRPGAPRRSAPPLSVDVRGHREPARVVKLPFYQRGPAPRDRPRRAPLVIRSSDSPRTSPHGPQDPPIHADPRVGVISTATSRRSASRKFAVDQLTDLIMIELPAGRDHARRRQELRRGRERQGGQRPVRPGRRRGHRGQRRRGRQRPAPRRRPLRQGLADQDPGRRPGRPSRSCMDHDAYEKKVAEDGH